MSLVLWMKLKKIQSLPHSYTNYVYAAVRYKQDGYETKGNGRMSQTGPKKYFIPQNCEKYTNF